MVREIEFADLAFKDLSSSDLVCFASGDCRYVSLFAEQLCSSLERNAGLNVALHLHIINPDESSLELVRHIGEPRNLPISLTSEIVDLSEFSEGQRKVYFSVQRFVLLPKIVERYRRPVLMLDLDQVILSSLRPIMIGADVGIIQYPQGAWNILSKFSASVVYANCTVGSRQFFGRVSDYVSKRLGEPKTIAWHLDQAALAVTYLQHRDKPWTFEFYDPKIMLSTVGDMPEKLPAGTIFLSITYSIKDNENKLDSALFRSFAT